VAPLKAKGDLAEAMVAADLLKRGHKIAVPFGEDWDYDLIVCRASRLERVQVKHTRSDGRVIVVKCFSHSLTNGRVRRTKRYTAKMIDWVAVYEATTAGCYYLPASELELGKTWLHLRLVPPINGQLSGIRWARDYRSI
jgi:PD-(D/E)XK nuclease superfamily protein